VEDNTATQPEAAGRRAAAYWFIDGLPEIFFGVLYIVLGSAGLALGFHSTNPWLKGAMIAAALAFLLLFWKDRAILDYCKSRLTYPRTGYVSPPAEPIDRPWEVVTLSAPPPIDWNVTSFRTRTAFVFFVASRLVDIPIGRMANRRWSVPVLMALVALGVYLWNRLEPHRYSWQSALAIALAGILTAGLDVPPEGRQFLPLLIGGVWLLAHGVPTLVRYLRTYPAPKSESA
jgi:Zn-dependent protease